MASNFPAVFFDGMWRVLAYVPSDNNHTFPKLSSIPQAQSSFELRETDLSWQGNRIMDQGSTSSCVGHGSVAGMEISWKQGGNEARKFSPFFTYALINGGSDNGAMVSDALKALQKYGMILVDYWGDRSVGIYGEELTHSVRSHGGVSGWGNIFKINGSFDNTFPGLSPNNFRVIKPLMPPFNPSTIPNPPSGVLPFA